MKKTISIEQINKYNQMVEAAIGTAAYNLLALRRQYRDDDTKRWIGDPYGYFYKITTFNMEEGDEYYLKTVNGVTYLYYNIAGTPADRYCLEGKDVARAFFGV